MTTMYLRNRKEIVIAARVIKDLGYDVSQREIAVNDRYVCNLVPRYAGGDGRAAQQLERAIVDAVAQSRQAE